MRCAPCARFAPAIPIPATTDCAPGAYQDLVIHRVRASTAHVRISTVSIPDLSGCSRTLDSAISLSFLTGSTARTAPVADSHRLGAWLKSVGYKGAHRPGGPPCPAKALPARTDRRKRRSTSGSLTHWSLPSPAWWPRIGHLSTQIFDQLSTHSDADLHQPAAQWHHPRRPTAG